MQEREKREVLIVDGEADTLMDLFDRVYEEGYATTGVSTPREALSWLARRKPDLMIDHLHGSAPEWRNWVEQVRKLSPETRIILLGDERTRPPESMQFHAAPLDWVAEDRENSALIEVLKRASGDSD